MTNSYKDLLILDIDNIEPLELSNDRKAALKRTVLKSTSKKNGFKWGALLTSAAIIGISTITALSFTFPSVASQIPFMQNIIGYFNNEETMFENYGDFATEIGQVQTSNGVSVMIEDAVYDGTSITVSYALETDIDLGPSPHDSNFFEIKGASGTVGHGSLKQINDNSYVGLTKVTPYFDKAMPDEVEVLWEPKAFIDRSQNSEVTVTGDWKFHFKLSKLDGKTQLINQSVESNDVTVLFNSLEINDMSTVIHYEYFIDPEILKKWQDVTVQFDEIQDNLGNSYIVDGNGAQSKDSGQSYKSSGTIQSLDNKATSIRIIPNIYYSLGQGKGVETKEMEAVVIELE